MSGAGYGIDFQALGQGISTVFSGLGDYAEAKGYQKAAGYATQNAAITKRSTQIQEMQANREIFQAESGTQADIGGAGLKGEGSAQYLMKSNVQQAGLTKALIANQGLITEQGYEAEAAADTAMASAQQMAGTGGVIGGGIGILGSIF